MVRRLPGDNTTQDSPEITLTNATGSAIKVLVKGVRSGNLMLLAEVSLHADGGAQSIATQRFDAWGNVAQSAGSIPQFGYTGREPDATGLIFYRARYYHPQAGRFVSRDPLGFAAGINPYAYAGGNPILYNDPDGLMAQLAWNTGAQYWGQAKQTMTDFASGLDIGGAADQFGRKLASDFVNNNQGSFGAQGWLADKLAPYAQGYDGSSSNGQLAGAMAIGATLLTPGGAVGKAKGASAYSVAFETNIPKLGLGTRPEHFKSANAALESALKSDASFAKMAGDLGIQVPANRGTSPANWTWHHVPDQPGVLQLVPRDQHQWGSLEQPLLHPGGKGGFSIWGADY